MNNLEEFVIKLSRRSQSEERHSVPIEKMFPRIEFILASNMLEFANVGHLLQQGP